MKMEDSFNTAPNQDEAVEAAKEEAHKFLDDNPGQFVILSFPASIADMVEAMVKEDGYNVDSFIGAMYPLPDDMMEFNDVAKLAAMLFLVGAARGYFDQLLPIMVAENKELLLQMAAFNRAEKKRGVNNMPTWEDLVG